MISLKQEALEVRRGFAFHYHIYHRAELVMMNILFLEFLRNDLHFLITTLIFLKLLRASLIKLTPFKSTTYWKEVGAS